MWKPKTHQRTTIEVTDRVGEVTKTFRLEVPANTSFDAIEGLLMIMGAIPPRVLISPGAHEASFKVDR